MGPHLAQPRAEEGGEVRRTREPSPPPWPRRDELLEWGFAPCANPGCRVLVNPALGVIHCSDCRRRFARRGRR